MEHKTAQNPIEITVWESEPDTNKFDKVFLRAGGAIGISVGCHTIVKPYAEWHRLAVLAFEQDKEHYQRTGELNR